MWLERHAPELLDLKSHLYAPRVSSTSPLIWMPGGAAAHADRQRPMRRAVQCVIIPTLRIALDDQTLHREVRYSILIALGHLAATEHASGIRDIAVRAHAPDALNDAAVLSLALMRTEPGLPESDRIDGWLELISRNRDLPRRTRDLAGLLIGSAPAEAPTTTCTDATRARFLLAAARTRNPRWMPLALAWLDDPAAPPFTRRAAAMAVGALAHGASGRREAVVDRLRAIVRNPSVDLELRVLACFALGESGTRSSRLDLLGFAQTESLPIRLASLLTLHAEFDSMAPEQRSALRAIVRRLDGPADYAAVIDWTRGLYRDTAAIPDLVRRVPTDAHAAIALGLLGYDRPDVNEALWVELKRTSDPHSRRNAACALAMLREDELAPYLGRRLDQARTFSDQLSWVATIGLVGTHANVPALIAILHDRRQPAALRAAAVQALGRMGDLRRSAPCADAARLFVPGLEEPLINSWLAQR